MKRSALAFLCTLLIPTSVAARNDRVNQLPHGDRWGCTSCHVSASGGGTFTRFGSDCVAALVGEGTVDTRQVDWSALYQRDSDRDGFTNGEEVNDPAGTWRVGDRDPAGVVYNPGDPNSHPPAFCGDGRVTPPEECDRSNFRDLTCTGLGLDDGVLRCKDDCSFDRTRCGFPEADAGLDTPDTGTVSGSRPPLDSDDGGCSTTGPKPTNALLHILLAAVYVRGKRRNPTSQ